MPPRVLGENGAEAHAMQGTVLTVGEILVEIMATSPGQGFLEPIELVGPFPSGAPAIFIDQVAKLGVPCAMVGCVGNDDFGRLNIERLRRDGVDVSAIETHADAVTGSAFVRYRPDGQRDFVFNIKHSANGHIALTDAARTAISKASHLHVVGSSLVSPAIVAVVDFAMADIKRRGGTISFDPNVRKEILETPGLRERLFGVLDRTDLFLPSGDELELFSTHSDVAGAAKDILSRGISAVVLKQGASGARYIDAVTDISHPGFAVTEVDPTGAGDTFSAAFVAGWLRDVPAPDNLRRSNAAGALAVMRRGPMEGTSTPDEIDSLLAGRN
jgi:sugar/nucleoside kinase (ribokinase family)